MREESNEGRRAKCKQRASTTPGHFSAANRSRWFTGELSSQWPIERRRRQTPCLREGGGDIIATLFFFFLDRTSEQPAACVPAAPPAPASPAATSTQRGSGARPGRLPPPQPLARYPVANSPPSFVLSTTALVPAAPHQTSHNFPTPTSPRSVPSGRERWPGPAQHAAFTAQLSFLRRPPSTPLPSAPPRSGAPRSRIPPPHRTAAAPELVSAAFRGRVHDGSPAPRVRPARGWVERRQTGAAPPAVASPGGATGTTALSSIRKC